MRRLVWAGVGVMLTLALTGCGFSVPSDMVAIHVGEGPFEARKVKGCEESSTRGWMTNDTYEYFPTNEREWDASTAEDADGGRFKVVTKDNVEMYVPVNIRFTLITECKILTDFYNRYARRYGAHFDSDGTYNDEWVDLLRRLIKDPAENTLNEITQGYEWRKVWNDPDTKTAMQQDLQKDLTSPASFIEAAAKGKFFEGITVLIGKPEPVNPNLAKAVAEEQTKVAESKSQEAQAKADEATAKAQLAVSEAQAAKQRAAINGYRLEGMTAKEAMRAYNESQLITAGGNPYQPTYIVGSTR
jgi:hypothetical protein